MVKQRTNQWVLGFIGVGVALLGAGASVYQLRGGLPQGSEQRPAQAVSDEQTTVAMLANLSPADRQAKLQTMVQSSSGQERNRARYLLAADLLAQQQGSLALAVLADLEKDYPPMAAYILRQRARAYEMQGQSAEAIATWQTMIRKFPQEAVTAEAMLSLGRTDRRYQDRAIAQFSSHPRVVELMRQRLSQNPRQPDLLLTLLRSGHTDARMIPIADRLVALKGSLSLTPEDWQAIGFIYWEHQEYGKAADAYARAPRTSRNQFRAARSAQLDERREQAIAAYLAFLQQYTNAPETPIVLMRLIRMSSNPLLAQPFVDRVRQQFPDRAAEALFYQAELYDKASDAQGAARVRQQILSQYRSSDEAAELRWQQAQQLAKQRDFLRAAQWVEVIRQENPQSEVAPEAVFWGGRWSAQIGRQSQAQRSFAWVLQQHPTSYFAWRSANFLGLDVGNFQTVRDQNPKIVRPVDRYTLPAGSPVLQELYQLGQDRDAWVRWLQEFKNSANASVAEQFTDGILRIAIGDVLDGIFLIASLQRRTGEERQQYLALKQTPLYWQALYPFPFMTEIENWSQQRRLNPVLVTALIRQESRFMPGIKSVAGATGLMQVMPETGAWIAEKTNIKHYSLTEPDDNIKLGTWYLDYTHREYNNNSMLAVASYNAGPGKIAEWLEEKKITDPDEFVRAIPYDETRGYVKAVFENYWNYLRIYNPETAKLLQPYQAPSTAGL